MQVAITLAENCQAGAFRLSKKSQIVDLAASQQSVVCDFCRGGHHGGVRTFPRPDETLAFSFRQLVFCHRIVSVLTCPLKRIVGMRQTHRLT